MSTLEELVTLLQFTLNPDAQTRRGAEENLKARYGSPGFVSLLFQACVNPAVPEQIRQSAAIMFKNIVQYYWNVPTPQESGDSAPTIYFAPHDKQVIRENYLQALMASTPLIRSQLVVALRAPVREDFPAAWSDLLSNAIPLVVSNNPDQILIGLTVLFVVVRKYQFYGKEERQILNDIVERSFPILIGILTNSMQSSDLVACQITKTIIKTYWAAIQHVPPPFLMTTESFNSWFGLFLGFMVSAGPVADPNMDNRENSQHPHWKAKKWIANILIRFMSKHGNKSLCEEEDRPFAEYFLQNHACNIAGCFMQVLQSWRAGQFVPNRLIQQAIDYLEPCIDYAQVYAFLKPQLNFIMFDVIFKLFCFSDEDAQIWSEDPQEYVRKSFDLMEQYYDPKTAAVNFLLQLVKVRGKDILDTFMNFINGQLLAFNQNPADDGLARTMDGALHAIGVLHRKLRKRKNYVGIIEHMLMTYVFPLLSSPHGYLRARAVWVYGQYFAIKFTNLEHFQSMIRQTINLVQDADLPVRIEAAVTLRNYVNNKEGVVDIIRPILPQLLEAFFSIAQEIGTEDMIMVISTLIEKLGADVAPFAVNMVGKLIVLYQQYAEMDRSDTDADGTAAMAAFESYRAINTVLEATVQIPEIYAQVEPIVIPFVLNILEGDCADIMEEVMQTLAFMSYHAPAISPAMWSMFPIVCKLSVEFSDFFDVMMVPLDNFISRDQNTFLSGDNLKMVLAVCEKMLSDPFVGEEAARGGCKLIESIIHNCKGKVDSIIQPVLALVSTRLRGNEVKTKSLRVLLLETISNCLYYNAAATLQILASAQVLDESLNLIVQNLPAYTRLYDKKVIFIGLCSIFSVPVANIPQSIQGNLNQLFDFLVALLQSIHTQREKEAAEDVEDDDDVESDEDDEDEDDLNIGDHEDALDEDVNQQLKNLARKAGLAAGAEDDFDDEDLEEEEDFSTPIDNIDEFVMMATLINESNGQAASPLQALAQDRKDKFAAVIFQANIRMQEIQRAQQSK